jgi:hypothetical protein
VSQIADQLGNVFHQEIRSVISDAERPVRQVVAPQVRCDGVKTGSNQRRHLMSPAIREFREPMQQDDGVTLSCFLDVKVYLGSRHN